MIRGKDNDGNMVVWLFPALHLDYDGKQLFYENLVLYCAEMVENFHRNFHLQLGHGSLYGRIIPEIDFCFRL